MGCKNPETGEQIYFNPLPLGPQAQRHQGVVPDGKMRANSTAGRRRPWGTNRPHQGCDLNAPCNTPIYATVSGKIYVTRVSGRALTTGGGHQITVLDDNGNKHDFLHISEEGIAWAINQFTNGQRVEGGVKIGQIGTTGGSTGCHMHYQVSESCSQGEEGASSLGTCQRSGHPATRVSNSDWAAGKKGGTRPINPMAFLDPELVHLADFMPTSTDGTHGDAYTVEQLMRPPTNYSRKKAEYIVKVFQWRSTDPEAERERWKEEYNTRCAALGGVPDNGPTATPSPAPTSTPSSPSQEQEAAEFLEAGEESRNARRFQEQCFLMDNFQFFTVTDGVGQYGRLYPTSSNFVVLGGGNPQTLVSKMLMPKNMKGLMDLKPHEFASYVPYIKLFKVFYPSETSSGEEYELKFKNHLTNESLESMIKTGKGRGSGVGIKNFHWELAGSNVEEAERLIKAELTLYFQDLSDLVHRESLGEKNRNIGFIDLIHQENKFLFENSSKTSDCTVEGVGRRSYNNKYFRIKAHVGWSGPRGLNKEDRSKQELVSQTGYSFFLTMVRHEIDFKNDGTVELKIHYQAAMEGLLSSKRADILLMEENEELLKLEGQVKCIETSLSQIDLLETCNKITGEEAENMRSNWKKAMEGEGGLLGIDFLGGTEGIEEKIKKQREERYRNFMTTMYRQGKIYSTEVDSQDIGVYQDWWGDSFDKQQTHKQVANNRVRANSATLQPFERLNTASQVDGFLPEGNELEDYSKFYFTSAPTSGKTTIKFMQFGDILDVAFGIINHTKILSELRIFVGDIQYRDPRNGRMYHPNLSEIPISFNLFYMWFYNNCIAKQRPRWVLKDFLQSAITDLITAALDPKCFNKINDNYRKPRIGISIDQIPLTDNGECRITGEKTVEDTNNVPKIHLGDSRPSAAAKRIEGNYPKGESAAGLKFGQYMFIYGHSTSIQELGPPKDEDETREERDNKLGVYHFRIGSDRGLVKTINFKRQDMPHMSAARIAQDGPGLLAMRELYNIDVDMIGNAMWRPGSIVYVDVSTTEFSNQLPGDKTTISQALGLGGYYSVIKADSFIEGGKFETKLDCMWIGSGSGKRDDGTDPCEQELPNPKELLESSKRAKESTIGNNKETSPHLRPGGRGGGNSLSGNTGNQSTIGQFGANKK